MSSETAQRGHGEVNMGLRPSELQGTGQTGQWNQGLQGIGQSTRSLDMGKPRWALEKAPLELELAG